MGKWRINLYVVWFAQMISLMSFGFGMPFIPFYVQELGITDPDLLKIYVGILSAAPALGMGIMAPIWGILSDKLGKKLMLQRSMIFAALILMAMGFATQPWHLIVLRLAQGLFTGTITASSALIASNTPSKRLSYALGFLSSSTFIGFSAGPAIGGFIAESAGYRTSFIIGAAFMSIAFIVVTFVVKETKMASDIFHEKEKSKKILLKHFLKPSIVTLLLVLFFMRISRTIFNPYLPLYVQEIRGQTEGAPMITGIISAVIGIASAISGLTLSRLGDKYNKRKLMSIYLAIGVILSIPLFYANNLVIFAIALGVFYFAIGGIEPLIMSSSCENVHPKNRGLLFGIQGTVGGIGWFLSPMLGGFISIQYSFNSILIFIPVFILCALIVNLGFLKKARVRIKAS